ncbi:MAG: pyridoxine 4-dehydrogenase [Thermoleophilales bacterium]|jgi:aryl-alcohol dehydrogenase-like predicted oxidoreductase|nr:pyridoxine 4-dehydrogenase [Thermoleophilales bacterium]
MTAPAPAGTIAFGDDAPFHRMGFGAMRITGPGIWGEPDDPAAARAVLRRGHEIGVDFVDTADAYGPEVSERLIAQAMHPYPEGYVVATKGGSVRPGQGQWVINGKPDHLKRACEDSMLRLRVDQIYLYQLHAVDPNVPLAESVGALKELQDEGKIRHVGLSNVKLDELDEARGLVDVVSVQNRYSLSDRGSDDILAACERYGMAFLPYFPLAAGKLAKSGGALDEVAQHHGSTAGQVALAWLLARSPNMVPIPGTSSADHLEENMGAATLELSDEEFATLDAAGRAG